MLFSQLVITAASLSVVWAVPLHQHHEHKREADVVFVTEYQTTGSSTSSEPPTSPTTSPETPTDVPAFKPTGKGITYSPYTDNGGCKDLEVVKRDLAKLTEFDIIRLYGVDCDQIENVLQAKTEGQKLFLGIFFMDLINAGVYQIRDAINAHGSWDDVYTVSIGNELVNNGAATVEQIASYLKEARSALRANGYTGPVVSVDTHVATINNPGLCELSDYIAINAHAYFDFNTEASNSGPWLLEQIQRVWTACGGKKDVMVCETGWPHQGDIYGRAIASPEAQAAAISSIKSSVTDSIILFTAFDDLWKADGNQHCEKYWGLYGLSS